MACIPAGWDVWCTLCSGALNRSPQGPLPWCHCSRSRTPITSTQTWLSFCALYLVVQNSSVVSFSWVSTIGFSTTIVLNQRLSKSQIFQEELFFLVMTYSIQIKFYQNVVIIFKLIFGVQGRPTLQESRTKNLPTYHKLIYGIPTLPET